MFKVKIYVQDTLVNEVSCKANTPAEAAAGSFYKYGWDWSFHKIAKVVLKDSKENSYHFSMKNVSLLDAVSASLDCIFG